MDGAKPSVQLLLSMREHGLLKSPRQYVFSTQDALVHRLALVKELEGHNGCVNCLDWSPDGRLLASSSDCCMLRLWSLSARMNCVQAYHTGHLGNVFCVRFLPCHPHLLATCAADGMVRLSNIETGASFTYAAHAGLVHKVVPVPSQPSTLYSVSGDGTVRVYDVRARDRAGCVAVPAVGKSGARALHYACLEPTHQQHLAVAGQQGCVMVHDRRMMAAAAGTSPMGMPSGAQRSLVHVYLPAHLVHGQAGTLPQGRHPITSVVYNYNGSQLLCSYLGERIYLFDAERSSFPGPDPRVAAPATSDSGPCSTSSSDPPFEASCCGLAGCLLPAMHLHTGHSNGARDCSEGPASSRVGAPGATATHGSVMAPAPPSQPPSLQDELDVLPHPWAPIVMRQHQERLAQDCASGQPAGAASRLPDAGPSGSSGSSSTGPCTGSSTGGSCGQPGHHRHEARHAAAAPGEAASELPGHDQQQGSGRGLGGVGAGGAANTSSRPPGGGAAAQPQSQQANGLMRHHQSFDRGSASEGPPGRLTLSRWRAYWSALAARAEQSATAAQVAAAVAASSAEELGEGVLDRLAGMHVQAEEERHASAAASGPTNCRTDALSRAGVTTTYARKFNGHRSQRTIKDVAFLGPTSDYVLSGSECGRLFAWSTATGLPLWAQPADTRTVNCFAPHPERLMLATGGIDTTVKLFEPLADVPLECVEGLSGIVAENESVLSDPNRSLLLQLDLVRALLASRLGARPP